MNWQFCRNVFAMMVALPLLAFCLLVSPLQGAAVGTAFSYQGQLKNSGALVSGNYDFQFRLFDAASAGSQVGATLTRSSVPVTNGAFNVTLDFSTANYNNQALFLAISVRKTGAATFTALNPRQQLRPTPVALALAPSSLQSWAIPDPNYGIAVSNGLTGDAIRGYTNATSQNYGGFYGACGSTGSGVVGISSRGNGIFGASTHGHAIEGVTTTATKAAVYGHSTQGRGLYGRSGSNFGVHGESDSAYGIYGTSASSYGVRGYSANGYGVYGNSGSNVGIYGYSTKDDAIEGYTTTATKSGVYGHSDVGRGVYGGSTSNDGVVGATAGANRSGVFGANNGAASNCFGVTGRSTNGFGVHADGKDNSTIDQVGDILLAGNVGEILSNGDMYLQSKGITYVDIDEDNNATNAGFFIRNGTNSSVFYVYESGNAYVTGNLSVTGSKSGYVVDIAQNADTVPLTAGDVVMIVDSAEPLLGEIPLIKVRRASNAEPGAVVGIVDQHYTPEPKPAAAAAAEADAPEERAVAEAAYDSKAIAPGEYLTIVTLGSFKAMKADASFGAIKAGDRLVASPNPGHAMKSGAPQPGTLVGKALKSLPSGSGIIPVMVTLQ